MCGSERAIEKKMSKVKNDDQQNMLIHKLRKAARYGAVIQAETQRKQEHKKEVSKKDQKTKGNKSRKDERDG